MFQVPAGGLERRSSSGGFRTRVLSRGAMTVAGVFMLGEIVFLVAYHIGSLKRES